MYAIMTVSKIVHKRLKTKKGESYEKESND